MHNGPWIPGPECKYNKHYSVQQLPTESKTGPWLPGSIFNKLLYTNYFANVLTFNGPRIPGPGYMLIIIGTLQQTLIELKTGHWLPGSVFKLKPTLTLTLTPKLPNECLHNGPWIPGPECKYNSVQQLLTESKTGPWLPGPIFNKLFYTNYFVKVLTFGNLAPSLSLIHI